MDERIKAIRKDDLVGSGTCSTIDECCTDGELVASLDDANIKTVKRALVWAYDYEELFVEDALNRRWGDDDDPELKVYDEFMAKRKEKGM